MPHKFLFITPVSPFAMSSGAEQRSGFMLQALQSLGHVDVIQIVQGRRTRLEAAEEQGLRKIMIELAGANWSLRRYQPKPELTAPLESLLACSLSSYTAIVCRYLWPACQIKSPAHVPLVVDLDDYKYRTSARAEVSVPAVVKFFGKLMLHWLARRQLPRFKAAFVASQVDYDALSAIAVVLLPNVAPFVVTTPSQVPDGQQVLFVGSLWYGPNTEGVNWFLRNVWPQVISALPNATLTLAGAAPETTRSEWTSIHGVCAPGFVPDIGLAYAAASLVVAPIFCGGGSNIKVLEALGHARPCLTTPFVQRAFANSLVSDQHLLVANTADDFARLAIAVLRSPSAYQDLASAGHHNVTQAFTTDQFKSRVVHTMCHLPI